MEDASRASLQRTVQVTRWLLLAVTVPCSGPFLPILPQNRPAGGSLISSLSAACSSPLIGRSHRNGAVGFTNHAVWNDGYRKERGIGADLMYHERVRIDL